MITQLIEFGSTGLRKAIIFHYLFGPKSQSDISNESPEKISISSIERVTAVLNYMGFLIKSEFKENKQYYKIDWIKWITECFDLIGLNATEEEIKEIADIINKKELVSLYYYFSRPEFMDLILQQDEIFGKGSNEKDLPIDLLRRYLVKKGLNPAEYPIFFFMYANPFKKIFSEYEKKKKIDNQEIEEIANIFKDIYEKNKPIGLLEINENSIKEIDKELKKIEDIMKRIYVSKIEGEVNGNEPEED